MSFHSCAPTVPIFNNAMNNTAKQTPALEKNLNVKQFFDQIHTYMHYIFEDAKRMETDTKMVTAL